MNFRNHHYDVQKANGQKRQFDLYLPDGVRALRPRDERQRGDGSYAYGLVDDRGGARRIVMAPGAVPYQYLQEIADRAHDDEPVLERPGPRITAERWNEAWADYLRMKRDAEVGRKRYYQSGNRSR